MRARGEQLFGEIESNNRGFTLIEVMISLMVFVVLTLIFAACVPVAKKASKMNGQYSQAISLCQHKIDQLRAVGAGRVNYSDLAEIRIIDENPSTQPYSFSGVDDVASILPESTTTLSVVYGTDEVKVTATVTWKSTNYESKTSRASLSAIITNVE